MTFRIERKLSLNNSNIFNLKSIFYKKDFKKIFPDRFIFSCYFDTIDYQMYKDSIEGTVPRKKIRLRSYNKLFGSNIFFEMKINSVEGRFKSVKKVLNHKSILERGYFDHDYGICYPKLLVKYKRAYLKKKNVRLTIDTNVSFSKYDKNKSPYFSNFEKNDCAEIKCNNINELNELNLDQIQIIRNSKYCNGINEVLREKNLYTEKL